MKGTVAYLIHPPLSGEWSRGGTDRATPGLIESGLCRQSKPVRGGGVGPRARRHHTARHIAATAAAPRSHRFGFPRRDLLVLPLLRLRGMAARLVIYAPPRGSLTVA